MEARHRAAALLLAGAAAALGLLFAPRASSAAVPGPQDYARPPDVLEAKLSPSGNRLGLLMSTPDGRSQLMVLDLPRKTAPRLLAGFVDADVLRFDWVNDDRLVFIVANWEGKKASVTHAGTYAIDHDGKNSRELLAWGQGGVAGLLMYRPEWVWAGTIDDGSADIAVAKSVYDSHGNLRDRYVGRLNTLTGNFKFLSEGAPDHVAAWLMNWAGEPEILATIDDGRMKMFWRPIKGKGWVQVRDDDYVRGEPLSAYHLDSAEDRLLVTASRDGFQALYGFDLVSKKLQQSPLVAVKGFDLEPGLEIDSKAMRVAGFHFMTDRPATYWFDDTLDGIQRSVDAALPKGRVNFITCGHCESAPFLLVYSTSDTQPGEYFLFDREAKSLERLADARPWIDEAAQGRRSFHRVQTRDGLDMPVYVTHPVGAAEDSPLPAVILVHGGPFMRGTDWTWQEEAQFLASRGYRVIEPEFRGSKGYGSALYRAGAKQYGLGMLDDLHDALRWATQRGLVDPKRVCIMGGSYGGYAALMGPIRHPDDYRCAISFAGVTDLELTYTTWDSDLHDEARKYWYPVMMGDRRLDAETLRASSPLRRIRELKVPVLLLHGERDRRVPIEHATKFMEAAKAAGADVTYNAYPLAGHGFARTGDKIDYYQRVGDFLGRHIGQGAGAR